jgi:UDP-N-acetylglucosamine 2-epimerase (non-hydrolysing)
MRLVGSTGVDACLRISERADSVSNCPDQQLGEREFLLATIHRAENTQPEVLAGLLDAISDLAQDWPVLFPVHPRTVKTLDAIGRRPGITYLDPVGYPQMMRMLRRCRALLTDSGGLQEEAAVLGAPAFILRNETEWTEFVETGRHCLVGVRTEAIVHAVRASLDGAERESRMRLPVGLERRGAAGRVMTALHEFVIFGREDHAWNLPASASHGSYPGDASAFGARAHVEVAPR